jgi:putative transposase
MTEPVARDNMLLTYKYRLCPTRQQHRALKAILEQQRQLYNAALEERILAYRMAGKSISEVDQSRSLTVIRADDPAFAGVQRRIQRGTLKRLDRAYKAFFRRVQAGRKADAGFPKFKGREYFTGFSFDAFAQIAFDGKRLRFAGMPGGVRVPVDRPLPKVPDPETGALVTSIKNVWFKAEDMSGGRTSRWYVGFQVEIEPKPEHARGQPVGADWGTSALVTLSTGEQVPNLRHGEVAASALARAQRKIARCKKGSKRRMKARRQMRKVAKAARYAAVRPDAPQSRSHGCGALPAAPDVRLQSQARRRQADRSRSQARELSRLWQAMLPRVGRCADQVPVLRPRDGAQAGECQRELEQGSGPCARIRGRAGPRRRSASSEWRQWSPWPRKDG